MIKVKITSRKQEIGADEIYEKIIKKFTNTSAYINMPKRLIGCEAIVLVKKRKAVK